MKCAIFPGSFDPFHKGHLYVIEKALKKFDFLYVVISWNEKKIRKFTFEQMLYEMRKELNKYKNLEIIINENLLTVDIARRLNCFNLVRGIRNHKDEIYEQNLKKIYQKEEPRINIFYFYSNNKLKFLSSSKIKKNDIIDE